MDFWQWLVDLFTRMGEAQTNNTAQLTGFDPTGSYISAEVPSTTNSDDISEQVLPSTDTVISSNDVGQDDAVSSALDNVTQGGSSLADYIQQNPGLSGEAYLKHMSTLGDEYAEQYINYLLERESIDRANEYTASREDTAYQRLTQDLVKAGLNPAMIYGGHANISASGSSGVVKMTDGANSRTISNYDKIKKLILAYMLYSLKDKEFVKGSIFDLFGGISNLLGNLF